MSGPQSRGDSFFVLFCSQLSQSLCKFISGKKFNNIYFNLLQVYIPELGMTFKVQPDQTRLFACQNPLNQGGGRKGLPKSFLNRFTQVN